MILEHFNNHGEQVTYFLITFLKARFQEILKLKRLVLEVGRA